MNQTNSRPIFNPLKQEWSRQIRPNRWLVWKHGTLPGDNDRLLAAAVAELDREEAAQG